MRIENMPGCCTSAILFSFGEHGEESEVTLDEINRLCTSKASPQYRDEMMVDNGKRCIFAISVDPQNIALLKEAGFKVVDIYEGIQGKVHILTCHL